MGEMPRYAWGGPQQTGGGTSQPHGQPDPPVRGPQQSAGWSGAPAWSAWPGGAEQPTTQIPRAEQPTTRIPIPHQADPAFAEQTTTAMPKRLPGQAGPYAWGAGSGYPPGYGPGEEMLDTAASRPQRRSPLGKVLLITAGGAVLIAAVASGAFLLTQDDRGGQPGRPVAVQTPQPAVPAGPQPAEPQQSPGTDDAATGQPKLQFKTTDFFRKDEQVQVGAVTYQWLDSDTGYSCSKRIKGKALDTLANQRNCAQAMRWLFVDPQRQTQVTVGLLLMKDPQLAARARQLLVKEEGVVMPLDPPKASQLKPLPDDAEFDVQALTDADVVIFSDAAWSDGHAPAAADRQLFTAAATLRQLVQQRLPEVRAKRGA